MNLRKLGQLVRLRREASGMTREEVAARAGVHWRTVGNLERCDVDTLYGVAVAIAGAVGLTLVCVASMPGLADNGPDSHQREIPD